ncbi:unnamed protein product, partial [Musa acuminata subsp. burmannicoides]
MDFDERQCWRRRYESPICGRSAARDLGTTGNVARTTEMMEREEGLQRSTAEEHMSFGFLNLHQRKMAKIAPSLICGFENGHLSNG